jgi:hypothetical protein
MKQEIIMDRRFSVNETLLIERSIKMTNRLTSRNGEFATK